MAGSQPSAGGRGGALAPPGHAASGTPAEKQGRYWERLASGFHRPEGEPEQVRRAYAQIHGRAQGCLLVFAQGSTLVLADFVQGANTEDGSE